MDTLFFQNYFSESVKIFYFAKKLFKVKILFFSILLMFSFSLFAQTPVDAKNLEEKSDIYYYKGQPYTGACFENWPSGKKGIEGNYLNGKKDGVWIWYYESGTKKRETNYRNGKIHGLSIVFYKTGKKRSEIVYDNGLNIKQIRWDENGNFLPPAQFGSD